MIQTPSADTKHFALTPTILDAKYTSAYKWMKSSPVIRYRTNAGGVLECLVNTSTSTGIKIPEMEINFQTINHRSWN